MSWHDCSSSGFSANAGLARPRVVMTGKRDGVDILAQRRCRTNSIPRASSKAAFMENPGRLGAQLSARVLHHVHQHRFREHGIYFCIVERHFTANTDMPRRKSRSGPSYPKGVTQGMANAVPATFSESAATSRSAACSRALTRTALKRPSFPAGRWRCRLSARIRPELMKSKVEISTSSVSNAAERTEVASRSPSDCKLA